MLKFDLIPGGRHDVPPEEDLTDPKITPKIRREKQVRLLLHPWPNILDLFLFRVRRRQAVVGDVCREEMLWYAQAFGRMLHIFRAADIDTKEFVRVQAFAPDWAIDALEEHIGYHMWLLAINNVFLKIGNGRPMPAGNRPPEPDQVFVGLMREIFLLACCTSSDQVERISRLAKCHNEFSNTFLHADFEETVGWR